MATSTLPAIDRARTLPATRYLLAGLPSSQPIDPAPPGPGDPTVPYVPATPRRLGRRVQLLLTEPTTHRPLATPETAHVKSCTFRYGPGSMDATVAAVDPVWELVRNRSTVAYGQVVHEPDMKSIDWAVGLDGTKFCSGVFKAPQRGPGGVWNLAGDFAETVLDERALGETEQKDFYNGKGSWPSTASFSPAGWTKTPNVTVGFNTTDPFEGDRSLVAVASGATPGYIYGPWVELPGHPAQVLRPVASAVLRIDSDLVAQVMCQVQTLAGVDVAEDFTLEARGVTDDADSDWQVVAGRGRLSRSPALHRVRAVIVIPASGDQVGIDLVRIQWPTLTGYATPQDLAKYPGRILRDAQLTKYGGSQWGITTVVQELTGRLRRQTFPHQQDIPVAQAMRDISDMVDGPDWLISPNWRCIVGPRGQFRFDFAMTPDNILACEMNPDPGGETDEFRGLTNRGSGSYRHVHGVNQPRRPNRRRVRQITSVPDELSYDSGARWTQGLARDAAQPAFTAVATMPFDEGLAIVEGDTVLFAWRDGDAPDAPAYWGPVRIAERTFDFDAETCRVSVAAGSAA